MESWVYKQGEQKGAKTTLTRQFERRLGRPMTEQERDALTQRFTTVGSERLGDVVLDLSPEALAAWLNDPDAV